ncbi:phytanoyl-CoA dioxygenase family protein [Chloroflexi bacterium TSY]|nr:phytanoyl-CoA dioxygenase family protein [Chloroflexi bacterium TSY]
MSDALELVSYTELEDKIEAMERDGYVYFPGFLNADEVAELRAVAHQLEPSAENFDIDMSVEKDGHMQKCINAAFNRDPLFLKYLDKPDMIELAEVIHGSDCHIVSMHTWLVGPGRPDQQLHADWQPFTLPEDVLADPRVRLPIFITTAHVYLDDMTEELGPTKLIPGSHRSGRKPNGANEWNGVKEQSFLGKAGDCIFFRSEIWHRGSANKSDQIRHTFMIHYAHRMITHKFPPYLTFQYNPEVIAAATPRQRRLLGDHVQSNYD